MSEQMSFTYTTDVERHYVFVCANIDVGTITPTRQGTPSETSSHLSNTLDKYQRSLGSQLRHVHICLCTQQLLFGPACVPLYTSISYIPFLTGASKLHKLQSHKKFLINLQLSLKQMEVLI